MIVRIKKKCSHQIQKIDSFLQLRKQIKLNKNWFLSGRYYFLAGSKPILYLHADHAKKFSYGNINSLKNNIWRLLSIKVQSNEKHKGELIIIDRKDNIKVFDIENNYIYTIMKDLEVYQKLYIANQEMKDIYNITFVNFNDKHKTITEKYIDFKKREHWTKDELNLAIKEVCENTKKSLLRSNPKKNKNVKTLIKVFCEKNPNKEYVGLVTDLMGDKVKNEDFSIIRSHGDMHFNNLLLENGVFYAIDWDESVDTVFFYDFFHMIFTDWRWNLNPYFIEKYFSGEYDELLTDVFSYSSQSYDKNKKNLYLSIYVMNRYLLFENSSVNRLDKTITLKTMTALKNLNSC